MFPFPTEPPAHAPLNKMEFYERWLNMHFGNRPRCWLSLDELKASGYDGKFSVRSRTPGGRLQTKQSLEQQHSSIGDNVVYQESLPDQFLVIQASMGRDPFQGLWIEYCLESNIHFRQAMQQSTFARGLEATMLLRRFVDPSSLDDLFQLTDSYPNAVIEFATYTIDVGVLPRRRTVIFEVREY